MNIDKIDLKMKLLAGDPLYVEKYGFVNALTLSDIKNIGFNKYNQYLSLLVSDISKIDGFKDLGFDEGLTLLHIIILTKEEQLTSLFSEALSFFCDNNYVSFDPEEDRFVVGGGIIDLSNYKNFQDVIKYQNCLLNPDGLNRDEYNPKDEKAEEIVKKLKIAKEKVKKYKDKSTGSDNEIDFADVISSVSTKSFHYDKRSIWDLTLYQLYDEFNRLRVIDDYNMSIQAIVAHGSDEIKIKHWATTLGSDD